MKILVTSSINYNHKFIKSSLEDAIILNKLFEIEISLSLALSILVSKIARTKLDDKIYCIDKFHKDEM